MSLDRGLRAGLDQTGCPDRGIMDTHAPHRWLIAAVALLVAVMFLLPLWSFDGYSLLENTTSHLGA